MIVLSLEQAVGLLCVCFFGLGFLTDRVAIWFYEHYVLPDEDDQFTEDECCQEAI